MKLKSFGCSFMYGSELQDRNNVWPSLVAQHLGLEHENHAMEGAGNLRILESVMQHGCAGDVCVVSWTWIDRFDHVDVASEEWSTIVPSRKDALAITYYRDLHSQYRDMLTNLVYVKTARDFLVQKNISYVMTYMDKLMLEAVRNDWHDNRAVSWLQAQLRSDLKDFQGLTFLEWSQAHGYPISDLWHPLDRAHAAAVDVMKPFIESILHRA